MKSKEDVKYKWSKIFAAKRFNGKSMTLDALEQDEILNDILGIGQTQFTQPAGAEAVPSPVSNEAIEKEIGFAAAKYAKVEDGQGSGISTIKYNTFIEACGFMLSLLKGNASMYCTCTPDETTGWSEFPCCNICGKIVEGEKLSRTPEVKGYSREQIEQYGRDILQSISDTFLNQENINKAELQSDIYVFKAIGETIKIFPLPSLPTPPTDAAVTVDEWSDNKVIDFVNWYLKVQNLHQRFSLENRELIYSFKRGDSPDMWTPKL